MTQILVDDQTVYVQRTQFAGANIPYEIDVTENAVSEWSENSYIPIMGLARPTEGKETGFFYQNQGGVGQTGPNEPAWSATDSVQDGSVLWTPVPLTAPGVDAIMLVDWAVLNPPDDALVISTPSNDPLTACAYLGGGTPGYTYEVVITVTMESTARYVVHLILTVL